MTRAKVLRAAAGAVFACATALLAAGCESKAKVVPVEGVLKIAGKPAANVSVQLLPDHLKGNSGPTSYGTTDAEGKFRLKAQDGQDGAVAGPHVVILADLDEERPPQGVAPKRAPRLDSKYTTASGGLKTEVPASGGSVTLEVPR